MPPEDDISSLERLRRKLYVPGAENAPAHDPSQGLRPAAPAHAPAPAAWEPDAPPPPKPPRRFAWSTLFLAVAGAFFVIAVGVGAYFLMFGGRAVSADRIAISIDAPTTISSGDEVTLIVTIENRNPVAAKDTLLHLDFPESARRADDPSQPLRFAEDTVGDIASGASATYTVRAVFSGAEGEQISIPAWFEFRVEGSNATFRTQAPAYELIIDSSPLSVRAEAVSETSVGQPVTFSVAVRSNAQAPLENVAVLASYPFGFSPRGEPLIEVGTLAPGEERTVSFTGILTGEDAEERVLRFSAGTKPSADATFLGVTYATAIAPVTLARPFLDARLAINRDESNAPAASADSVVSGTVSWTNALPTQLLDGQVTVALSGPALDPSSVSAYGGYYRSSSGSILYSRENDASLARLEPGASGTGTFTFRTKSAAELRGVREPSVTATVSVAGRRVGEANVPETMSGVIVRTIRIATELSVSARASVTAGASRPTADQESTYSVTLSLANSLNTVADATVVATIPQYVRYVSAGNPSLLWNETARTLTWKAGEVAAGTGQGNGARSVTFDLVLLPSVSQRGTSPMLLSAPSVTGHDRYADREVSSQGAALTTDLSGSGSGTVR